MQCTCILDLERALFQLFGFYSFQYKDRAKLCSQYEYVKNLML